MQSVAAANGVSGKVDRKPGREEKADSLMGSDGLPKIPNDPIAFINGGPLTPKVPTLDGNSFDDVFEGIADETKEVRKAVKDVAKANKEIKEDSLSCVKKAEKTLFEKAEKSVQELGTRDCGWQLAKCDAEGNNAKNLRELFEVIEEASDTFDADDAFDLADLGKAVKDECSEGAKKRGKLAKSKEDQEEEVDRQSVQSDDSLILKQAIENLGAIGDLVDVSSPSAPSATDWSLFSQHAW